MIDPYRFAFPLIRRMDPEKAHGLAISALKNGLIPACAAKPDPILRSTVWGVDFPTPIGLAAGFDKNAECMGALLRLGFGYVEVGSITPRSQPGNPKPRMFRLEQDKAVINRLGFNSQGIGPAAGRLAAFRNGARQGIVGVNLGKNKLSEDAAADYAAGVAALGPYADYLVVNVSSPNTPGLRALQGPEPLRELLSAVLKARAALDMETPPPLLLKIAPDLTAEDRSDIAAVVLDLGIDGLIATNTTISRPAALLDPKKTETGGLSGAPLFPLATEVLADMYRLTNGTVPIIGVGGIATAAEAYAKIKAGASLVQFYSAMIYQGPGLAARMAAELAGLLKQDGFGALAEAVGADHR